MRINSKVLVFAASAFVVVLMFAYFAWAKLAPHPKVYGQVGSHQITQTELNATMENTIGVSQSQAISALADRWLYYYAAQDLHINVTDKEISDAQTQALTGTSFSHNYLKVTTIRNLYKAKLEQALTGYSRGQFVVAHFDQNIPVQGASISPQEAARTPQQTQQLEDEDKKYAMEAINNVSSKLKSKKITFDQAVQQMQYDPRIGTKALPTVFQSGSFNSADDTLTGNVILSDTRVRAALEKLNAGQISEPIVGQVAIDLPGKGPFVDGYSVVLKLTESQKQLKQFKSFDDLIGAYKSKLHYRIEQ